MNKNDPDRVVELQLTIEEAALIALALATYAVNKAAIEGPRGERLGGDTARQLLVMRRVARKLDGLVRGH